jgi:hypothetical protein
MGYSITQCKENLSAMLHGGSLNKVRNLEALFERAMNTMLTKIDPLETIRLAGLTSTIHDDVYNYALPSDYKKIIDLMPQDNRQSNDTSNRRLADNFDLQKALSQKTISIEGSEGTKIARINWRSRSPKTLHTMNSLTDNGTWSAVGTATGLAKDDICKVSGSASIRFDLGATGDGLQNTTMTAVDLTDEDEVADVFAWVYFPAITNLTSLSLIWGNDLTTNYWTSVAQTTQADGTAFKIGWNLIKFPWSTATESGTVAPATVDAIKLTVASTGAIANIRVDNITCSIGRNFDIKYYSKYIIKDTNGNWISRYTTDDDTVVLDNDSIQILFLELLIAGAHQIEAVDSSFDIGWAKAEADILYKKYKAENPTMSKKAGSSYGGSISRGRW